MIHEVRTDKWIIFNSISGRHCLCVIVSHCITSHHITLHGIASQSIALRRIASAAIPYPSVICDGEDSSMLDMSRGSGQFRLTLEM
jgi:hypothetical protein